MNSGKLYDIITSWGFFEHLTEPSRYFEDVSRLLSPNGVFIFLVNNIESPASRVFMQEDIPRHLHIFSPSTVAKYLQRYHMQLDKVYHTNDVFAYNYPNVFKWAYCRLTKQTFDPNTPSFSDFREVSSLRQAGMLIYNYSDKVVGRLVRSFFKILHKNGIIVARARKMPISSLDKAK